MTCANAKIYTLQNEENKDSDSDSDLEHCVLYNEILLRKIEEVFPEVLPKDKNNKYISKKTKTINELIKKSLEEKF